MRPKVGVAQDGTTAAAWIWGDGLPFDYGEPGTTHTTAYTIESSRGCCRGISVKNWQCSRLSSHQYRFIAEYGQA